MHLSYILQIIFNNPASHFMSDEKSTNTHHNDKLVKGIDYYLEDGKYVFTEHYLLKRGYCCESGCRHCPYRSPGPEEK